MLIFLQTIVWRYAETTKELKYTLEIELKAGPQNDFKALKGTPVNYLLATRASFNIHGKG